MCVCMYVCKQTYVFVCVRGCLCIIVCLFGLEVFESIHTFTYLYVYTHTNTHIRIQMAYIFKNTRLSYLHKFTLSHMHIHTCKYAHYTYTHIHTPPHTHTRTHTCIPTHVSYIIEKAYHWKGPIHYIKWRGVRKFESKSRLMDPAYSFSLSTLSP